MSAARLAGMMSGQAVTYFVATQSGGASSTGFYVPVSGVGGTVRAGDFLMVEYYSGYNLSGGAGAAFTTSTFGGAKVSSRCLETGDLMTPFAFDGAGPYILMIVRGPSAMGPAVRSGTLTGSLVYPTEIGGIVRTSGAGAIIGFAVAQASSAGAEAYYHTKTDGIYPGPFDRVTSEIAHIFGYTMGILVDVGSYAGAPFNINTEDATNTIAYRIHELF